MPDKHKSNDFKQAAINHYLNVSHNLLETSRIMGCNNKTLGRWVDRFEQDGNLERQNRVPVSYKIAEGQVNYATNYLREHKTTSMAELHGIMLGHFPNFNVTPQHLGKVIRDKNLTRKRTRHGHYPKQRYRQPTDLKADLQAFYAKTAAHAINKIICIDETSLTPFMYRAYSRCNLGERCIEKTDNNKVFTKHTFIGAITNARILDWKLYDTGAMNQARFLEFVSGLINRHRLRGYLFVFDNAGAHKGQQIKDRITSSGNSYVYTVPYNPQTNAIETWFSQFKHYMSTSIVRTIPQMRTDIINTIRDKILPAHYANHFKYAYRRGEYEEREVGVSSRRRAPKNYKEDEWESDYEDNNNSDDEDEYYSDDEDV